MTAVDLLGLWLPLSGILVLGLMWLTLRDTLRTPPGGEDAGAGGGSDRVGRPPWSWSRRGGRGVGRARGRPRARVRR